jgi:hypothetical protein
MAFTDIAQTLIERNVELRSLLELMVKKRITAEQQQLYSNHIRDIQDPLMMLKAHGRLPPASTAELAVPADGHLPLKKSIVQTGEASSKANLAHPNRNSAVETAGTYISPYEHPTLTACPNACVPSAAHSETCEQFK